MGCEDETGLGTCKVNALPAVLSIRRPGFLLLADLNCHLQPYPCLKQTRAICQGAADTGAQGTSGSALSLPLSLNSIVGQCPVPSGLSTDVLGYCWGPWLSLATQCGVPGNAADSRQPSGLRGAISCAASLGSDLCIRPAEQGKETVCPVRRGVLSGCPRGSWGGVSMYWTLLWAGRTCLPGGRGNWAWDGHSWTSSGGTQSPSWPVTRMLTELSEKEKSNLLPK